MKICLVQVGPIAISAMFSAGAFCTELHFRLPQWSNLAHLPQGCVKLMVLGICESA